MAAILFFIALNAQTGADRLDPGTTRAISRYGAIEGQPHGALEVCRLHANTLNKDADGTHAYFCKELPEAGSTPKIKPNLKGLDQ